MKALTVAQPWASLIVACVKSIETRPSPPNGAMRPDGVRGLPGLRIEPGDRIAIHAAATPPGPVGDWIPSRQYGEWRVQRDVTKPGDLFASHTTVWTPLGAIVGTVVVAGAVPVGECSEQAEHICDSASALLLHSPLDRPWRPDGTTEYDVTDQLPLGDFTPGCWGWLLTDPERCEPVPVRGRQGVWEWTP